mgnify:CR=1 FL=1
MAVWFERIANPYNTFRRIANPPKHESICSAGFAIRRFLIADLQSAHAHTFISWLCGLSGLQILILIFGGLQIRQNTLPTAWLAAGCTHKMQSQRQKKVQ